jgi:NADH:ubiquinone oxidoreductase subunit H
MFLQGWQVPGANDVSCSDNSNPQFVIIFVHWLRAMSILQIRAAFVRAKFDRLGQLRVQP